MSSDFTRIQKGITLGILASDPVDGTNGDIYYNNVLNKFRKYENSVWSDLDTVTPPSSITIEEFTSSGVFNAPAGTEDVFILAVGGGGGGGGGAAGNNGDTGGGGGSGGRGATPTLTKVKVTSLAAYTVTLGAGGNAGNAGIGNGAAGTAGTDGGATSITGPDLNMSFPGGAHGLPGTLGVPAAAPAALETGEGGFAISSSSGAGGWNNTFGGNGGKSVYNNVAAAGGSGTTGTSGDQGGGGGGAGGSSIGIGGTGGHGGYSITPAVYSINSITRVSNVVTLGLTGNSYSTHQFNIGEYLFISAVTPDSSAATGTLAVTTPIVLTSVALGPARNGNTFTLQVNAAAANPTNRILVTFSGTAAAIVCTVTPNNGTNNGGTPVDLTTANLVQLINTGTVTGKTITLTDGSALRNDQTATGGDATNLVDGGQGDGVVATFSGGTTTDLFPANGLITITAKPSASSVSYVYAGPDNTPADQTGAVYPHNNLTTFHVSSCNGQPGGVGAGGGGGGAGGGGFSTQVWGGYGGAGGNGYVAIIY